MKRALQGILIAGTQMKEDVLYHKKKITIREGHRDYSKGSVLLGCPLLNWSAMRTIISVKHTTLEKVSREEFIDDGFESLLDLKLELKKYYPDIEWDSQVTIIRWK